MITTKNIVVGLISFIVSLAVLLPPFASSQNTLLRDEFHQTYPFSANGRVSLENINGDVRVEVWDRNEIKVDAVKLADTKEKLDAIELKIDTATDSIRIKTKYPDTAWRRDSKQEWKNYNPGSVEYTLTVPCGARIDSIELINGDLEIKNTTGEVQASTINGKLKAENLMGDSRLSTINGQLTASFSKVDGGRKLSLSTVNGRVSVTLPSDLNAEVKADTVHGSISNEFGLPVRKGEYVGGNLYGVIGGSGARINLNAVNGGVEILRAKDGKQLNNVTNMLSENDNKRSKGNGDYNWSYSSDEMREAQEELAEALRDAQQEIRSSQRDVERAQRDIQRAQRQLERALRDVQQNDNEETKEAIEDAKRDKKEAEEELKVAQKQLEDAQREMERVQKDNANELQKIREKAKARAAEDAKIAVNVDKIAQDAQRIAEEAMKAANVSVNINGGYNNLRFVQRDSSKFNTNGTVRLNASTYDGAITIRGWDSNEVSCTVTKRAEDEQQMKGVKYSAVQNGSEIVIKVEFDKAFAKQLKGGVYTNAVASLEINVPRNSQLKIHSGDGRLSIDGVKGNIEADTGDGGIDVRDCTGNIKIETGDGRVFITNHQGEASVNTGDGNLVLEGRFTKLFAETGDGSIVVRLPSDTNAIIDGNAESINVEGLNAVEENSGGERQKRWRIGNGGTVFKLSTGDGRISVRRLD